MVAQECHTAFAEAICQEIYVSSLERKTGIANRSPEYINEKIRAGKAVIALTEDGEFAGFSSRKLFPDAKIFSITTGAAVMKMNYEFGFRPVPFSELTDDPEFWKGCEGCRHFGILKDREYRMCLCTGLLYDPKEHLTIHHPGEEA